jgi:predicted RNA-binding Zn ribbon-like protein
MTSANVHELAIVGGHPALDLVNTVAPRGPADVRVEYLSSPADLLTWAERAGVISASEASEIAEAWSPESALDDVLALRDLVEGVLAGSDGDLDDLIRRWSDAIGRSSLRAGALTVGVQPATMISDRLADAIVDLVRHADLSRLRECPRDEQGCGWLFLDRSRNLSRKWCSMDDCGAHAKSRRLTQRRRARR